jgi:hypothetical protein
MLTANFFIVAPFEIGLLEKTLPTTFVKGEGGIPSYVYDCQAD